VRGDLLCGVLCCVCECVYVCVLSVSFVLGLDCCCGFAYMFCCLGDVVVLVV